jgi:hypothetical protein
LGYCDTLENFGARNPLIAQLRTAQIQDRVLHRACDALAASRSFALKQSGEYAGNEMNAGAGVANLRSGTREIH